MNVLRLISHEHIREVISEAQLDFGLAETEDDLIHLAFIHLGPDSELSRIRKALGSLVDTKGDLCRQPVRLTGLPTICTKP